MASRASITPTEPRRIYVRFSACGRHVRKWSPEPFEGATAFVPDRPTLLQKLVGYAMLAGFLLVLGWAAITGGML